MSSSPLCLYTAEVLPDWLDVNEHMNVAYYALVFDRAAEAFMAYLGVDNAYIQEQKASWVALESHTIFNCELQLADPLRVTAQMLDADSKRIHLFQTMMHVEQEFRAASNELMILHVDLERRCSSPFPDALIERVRRIAVAHRGLPRPPEQGRAIGLRKGVR